MPIKIASVEKKPTPKKPSVKKKDGISVVEYNFLVKAVYRYNHGKSGVNSKELLNKLVKFIK